VTTWDYANHDATRLKSSDSGPAIEALAATKWDGGIVTAVQESSSDKFRVIYWNIDASGKPSQADSKYALSGVSMSEVSMCATSPMGVVTAGRDQDNKLRLISWDYVPFSPAGPAPGVVRRAHHQENLPIERVAICSFTGGVVTAVQEAQSNDLKIISWKVVNHPGFVGERLV
jgi:hypothetical protein